LRSAKPAGPWDVSQRKLAVDWLHGFIRRNRADKWHPLGPVGRFLALGRRCSPDSGPAPGSGCHGRDGPKAASRAANKKKIRRLIVNAFRSRFDSIQWPNSKSRTILAPRLRGIVGKAQPVLKPLISGEDLRLPFVRRLRFGRGSLAICGHCGRKLRTHYTSRTASPGYHCAGASASAPCRSTRLWAAPDRNRAGLGQPAVAPLLPVPTMGETL
jgi:hypothetical protein